jgi:peptidoglycan hydrolase-like protein with peptidoglycan-binding domain
MLAGIHIARGRAMALRSRLFQGDPKLEAAAVSNSAHIAPGAAGDHVRKIQYAVAKLDEVPVDQDGFYGPKTAAAVLNFKKARDIINRSYQSQADNIVGIMTIKALDDGMFERDQAGGFLRVISCRVVKPNPQA